MKIIETKKSLVRSILFLIFGALIFAYPNEVVTTASMIVGAILIIYAIIIIVKNYYDTKQDSNTNGNALIFGITLLVIGILFIVLAGQISKIIQYILGAWILFTGIERLAIALSLGKDNNSFITQLIIAILLLIAGIYTIMKAHIEIQIVGIVMMIYAVLEIIGYISNNKNNSNITVEETIEKKITTKEEVKEAKVVEEKPKKRKKK